MGNNITMYLNQEWKHPTAFIFLYYICVDIGGKLKSFYVFYFATS